MLEDEIYFTGIGPQSIDAGDLDDGTFGEQVTYPVGRWPTSVAAGDFDDDDVDLAVTSNAEDCFRVLLNQGDGTYMQELNYQVTQTPRSALSAKLNDDHLHDLAFTNVTNDVVSIQLNGRPCFADIDRDRQGDRDGSVLAIPGLGILYRLQYRSEQGQFRRCPRSGFTVRRMGCL